MTPKALPPCPVRKTKPRTASITPIDGAAGSSQASSTASWVLWNCAGPVEKTPEKHSGPTVIWWSLFWHEWVLPLSFTLKSNGFCALTSRHHDSARLGSALRWLGVEVCPGSVPGVVCADFRGGNTGPHRAVTGDLSGRSQGSPLHRQGGCRRSFETTTDANDSPRICGRKIATIGYLGPNDSSLAGIPGGDRRRRTGHAGDRRRDDAGITDALESSLNRATESAHNDFDHLWRQEQGLHLWVNRGSLLQGDEIYVGGKLLSAQKLDSEILYPCPLDIALSLEVFQRNLDTLEAPV